MDFQFTKPIAYLSEYMKYIERKISSKVLECSKYYQVLVITGPRQTGKTTLCRHLFNEHSYYNLEDVALRIRIAADPKGFLKACGRKVIIDEVQHVPELLSYIQLIVDEDSERSFVLTGSNNFALMEGITQSLAGRACMFTLMPLSISELVDVIDDMSVNEIILRGFFPGAVLKNIPSEIFYANYYTTYIERDVRQVKNITDIGAFQQVMHLMAGRTGSEMNASALASETGISAPTIRSWNSVLETSYLVYPLRPYFANISKRLVKSPKVYFVDTGLLCFLLGIKSAEQLAVHPLRGALFENLVVNEMLKHEFNSGHLTRLYFYRENAGREIDIVKEYAGTLSLFEVKSASTFNPSFTANINYLKKLLGSKVKSSIIIYTGDNIPPDVYNYKRFFESYQ